MRRVISQMLPERLAVVAGDNTKALSIILGRTDRAVVGRMMLAA